MLLGTRDRFGIECFVRSFGNQPVTGDLWLWASAMRIGDDVGSIDLPLLLEHLSGPLRLGSLCYSDLFDGLAKEQVVDTFVRIAYGRGDDLERANSIVRLFYRYLVVSAYNLEGLDSWFFLVLGCRDGRDRLIWKLKSCADVHERLLEQGEYGARILGCFDWLENQTGYRSPYRVWLGLPESARNSILQEILVQYPELESFDQRHILDEIAIEELKRREG